MTDSENNPGTPADRADTGGDLGRITGEESANVKMLNLLLEQAIHEGASDLHVEPKEFTFNIRIRVDGKLRVIASYPKGRLEGLVNLIKVQTGTMRQDNSKVPDSGVLQFTPPGADRPVDIRVETAPTAWGQAVVMRPRRPAARSSTSPSREHPPGTAPAVSEVNR